MISSDNFSSIPFFLIFQGIWAYLVFSFKYFCFGDSDSPLVTMGDWYLYVITDDSKCLLLLVFVLKIYKGVIYEAD